MTVFQFLFRIFQCLSQPRRMVASSVGVGLEILMALKISFMRLSRSRHRGVKTPSAFGALKRFEVVTPFQAQLLFLESNRGSAFLFL